MPIKMHASENIADTYRRMKRELARRLTLESLLAEISTNAVSPLNMDKFLQDCLESIGDKLDISRVYIMAHCHETHTMTIAWEWVAPDILALKPVLRDIAASRAPWWVEMMKNGRVIKYASIEEIPGEPDKALLRQRKVQSILAIPLFVQQEYYGFIGFDECREPREWPSEDVTLLRTISQIISRSIERRETEKTLREENDSILKQLQLSQKMEAIGTLAGGVAHDFNNLLMGIQGNTSLLLNDLNPGDRKYEALKKIEKLVINGAKLTSQLLGYTRRMTSEVTPLNLNQLVAETVHIMRRVKKEITFDLTLSDNLYPVMADQSQIEQVLFNLFFNAADAMPFGGKIVLKTMNRTHKDKQGKHFKPKPGEYTQLSITDTGMGMDPKTQARIFEPFFTTKEAGRGTGLGLSSALGIIQHHGGYIRVDSQKDHGTTFTIDLPATHQKVPDNVEPADKIIQGKGTVLLVDDEEIVLETSTHLLEKLGYSVLTAEDGKQAIAVYTDQKDTIDMVILDMIMPIQGGGEVFDQMKAINPEVKVLLSSGYSMDGQAAEILDRGCAGFIQKPFSLQKLSAKIKEIIEG